MNITLYALADYTSGKLNPFTIDLDDLTDHDEYLQAIAKGLWDVSTGGNVTSKRCDDCDHVQLSEHSGDCPECGSPDVEFKATNEEWIACDSEDIPSAYVGEYDLTPEFWGYKEALAEAQRGGMSIEAFDAGISLGISPEDVADSYQGEYDDDKKFAYDMAEAGGFEEPSSWPYNCIDWEHAARELMYDYHEENGHYFAA